MLFIFFYIFIINQHSIGHMMKMFYQCEHISANCNPMPSSLVFLNNNTIAFCFRNQVGIYDVEKNQVLQNLNYRKCQINRANCIISIDQFTIVVGYDSGHLIIFCKNQSYQWKVLHALKQNSAVVQIYFHQNTIITNNVQAELLFYSYITQKGKQPQIKQINSLKFPLNKILQSFVQITHKNIKILLLGGTDQKIHSYIRSNDQSLIYKFELSGHENAITKLAVTKDNEDYLLASSSKDGYIRVWRFTQNQQVIKFHKNVKKIQDLYCFLDAVLISHESSVTNLLWTKFSGKLQLISCSLDCTICLWQCENSGAWTVSTRMGQFLGNKNAYFNIVASQNYQYLVAVNYIGSALIWNYNVESKKFVLRPSFNGHTNQVKDIDWDHTGRFLVSVSKDQTTRIISKNQADHSYHQISRAQVHGYDINAVSVVKARDGVIDLIACGADQKVIRIVQPPACFANYLNYFTKINLHLFFPSQQQQRKYTISKPNSNVLQYETYAQGGTQVLGLMTKVQRVEREKITSYYDDEQEQPQEQQQKLDIAKQSKINFNIPPHDDYLVKHTLWPEMNKLYGHPHEISALAKCNKRRLLASSCSGKSKAFCTIIIWSTEDWKIKKMIQHHNYTVYGMDFSQCGKYFASVSKDRKLAIYDQNFDIILSKQAHARAITCVSFSPDSKLIVTGSRDKTIKIHYIQQKDKVLQFQVKKQVDAVTFCDSKTISIGCIDGTILFVRLQDENISEVGKIQDKYSSTMAITKLRWKNGILASSSQDHSVRVFKINLAN